MYYRAMMSTTFLKAGSTIRHHNYRGLREARDIIGLRQFRTAAERKPQHPRSGRKSGA
jgi:hypothetical protein